MNCSACRFFVISASNARFWNAFESLLKCLLSCRDCNLLTVIFGTQRHTRIIITLRCHFVADKRFLRASKRFISSNTANLPRFSILQNILNITILRHIPLRGALQQHSHIYTYANVAARIHLGKRMYAQKTSKEKREVSASPKASLFILLVIREREECPLAIRYSLRSCYLLPYCFAYRTTERLLFSLVRLQSEPRLLAMLRFARGRDFLLSALYAVRKISHSFRSYSRAEGDKNIREKKGTRKKVFQSQLLFVHLCTITVHIYW